MDESDARGDPVVTATGGVTLQKRLETDDNHRPAVRYELESQRDTAVVVRLVEPVPSGLGPADLGFLGPAGDRPWAVRGSKLVLECRLEPGGTRRTGIAARGDRADAVGALLETPETVEVTEADGRAPDAAAPDDGSGSGRPVVEQLLAELREGAVSAETVAALRVEFGAADEVIGRIERRLDVLEERVSAVDGTAPARDADLASVEERVGGLEFAVDSLADEVEETAATLDREVERLEDGLPASDVDGRFERVESELAAVSEVTTSLKAAVRR